MDQYKDKEAVFVVYVLGQLRILEAIEILQEQFNMSSLEAEELVYSRDSQHVPPS